MPPFPPLAATNLLQMASLLKIGDAWRAQVRRKGHKSIAETFPTKAQAVAWARKVEAEMDARRFNDTRGLANITLKELIDWCFEEIGNAHLFGKKKTAVLWTWQRNHGQKNLADITLQPSCVTLARLGHRA